jgi:hypothetical protein
MRGVDRLLRPVPGVNRAARIVRRDLKWHRAERDAQENAETLPPDEEEIRIHCLWMTEFYGPAHQPQLVANLRRLGWDRGRGASAGDGVLGWIASTRARDMSGSWLNLSVIRRAGDQAFPFSEDRRAWFPAEVRHAFGRIASLSPAVTAVTMQFVLEEKSQRTLEDALRATYRTYVTKHGRYYAYETPRNQKVAAVDKALRELERACASWFEVNLPGAFADRLFDGDFPSAALVTTKLVPPFTQLARTEGHGLDSYMWLLGLDNEARAWASSDVPGLLLSERMGRDETRHRWILAGRHEDVFVARHETDREDLHNATIQHLDRSLGASMAFLAVAGLLDGYEAKLAGLRDDLEQSTRRKCLECAAGSAGPRPPRDYRGRHGRRRACRLVRIRATCLR